MANSNKVLGIDAGGSYFKFGVYNDDKKYLDHLNLFPLPYTREFLGFLFENHSTVLITGAGAQNIKNLISKMHHEKIEILPELLSTGLGGAYLADVDQCIVVNIGSGTPILYVDKEKKEVKHLGGTGMGSASLAGLSSFLTGISDLDEISREALKGNPIKVNLLISDIYSNPDDIGIPGYITASNFGKYQDWRHADEENKPSKADFLAGLHSMVGETIAMVSTLASRQYKDSNPELPIIITGGGTLNSALINNLEFTYKYLNQKYTIPENAVFATLHGVFLAKNMFTN